AAGIENDGVFVPGEDAVQERGLADSCLPLDRDDLRLRATGSLNSGRRQVQLGVAADEDGARYTHDPSRERPRCWEAQFTSSQPAKPRRARRDSPGSSPADLGIRLGTSPLRMLRQAWDVWLHCPTQKGLAERRAGTRHAGLTR